MDATSRTEYENTPENEAAEEAAFEATFATSTDQEPAAAATVDNEKTAVEVTGQEQPTEPVAEETVKEPTIADLLAIIEANKTEQQKLRDQVFGSVGDLKRRVDSMKTTAHGISPGARKRLEADFPELAEMLFEQDVAPAAEVPVQTSTPVASEDGDRKMERRLLTRDHRDWEQVVAGPEFAAWKDGVLKPEDAAALDESWDADFISGKITEFKAYKAEAAVKAATAERQAAEAKLKQERLNSAIPPRGNPRTGAVSSGDNEELDAMMANFKPRR